jgi:hypothetical protein
MIRFTDPIDLALLNQLSQHVEELQRQITDIKRGVKQHNKEIIDLQNTTDDLYFNTIEFTWTGGTTLVSWNAGFVQDKAGKVYPVPAGSKTLSASTEYWAAWNPVHQVMAFDTSLTSLIPNKNNLVLCQITTGSGAQTGTAGGGGSKPGGTDTRASYGFVP